MNYANTLSDLKILCHNKTEYVLNVCHVSNCHSIFLSCFLEIDYLRSIPGLFSDCSEVSVN